MRYMRAETLKVFPKAQVVLVRGQKSYPTVRSCNQIYNLVSFKLIISNGFIFLDNI